MMKMKRTLGPDEHVQIRSLPMTVSVAPGNVSQRHEAFAARRSRSVGGMVAGLVVSSQTVREYPGNSASRPPASATENATFDSDLATVVEAWPGLSEEARQDILAIVRAADSQEGISCDNETD
jgi:hypothetical protein